MGFARLGDADLRGANLGQADLGGASLVETILEDADLTGCSVYGTSVWNQTQPCLDYKSGLCAVVIPTFWVSVHSVMERGEESK
jgi:uncharacterized protein YjbI with pentapeptide repeats